VEVRSSTQGQAERERDRMLRQVYQLLERNMLPDLDVLLPAQNRSGSDFLHIVARTDRHGSEVMLKRLRDQLSRSRDLKVEDANCSVSSEIIEIGDEERNLAPDECVAQVAARIKERLK
jgi:hypothetical protein